MTRAMSIGGGGHLTSLLLPLHGLEYSEAVVEKETWAQTCQNWGLDFDAASNNTLYLQLVTGWANCQFAPTLR